jgi:peroxiredoxin
MTSILTGAAQAAHSAITGILAHNQIEPGQHLPAQCVKEAGDADKEILIHNLKGKILIVRPVFMSHLLESVCQILSDVGVPGAFTPPCSSHVPGYLENYEKFKEKGISQILVVAVNDAFVLK